MVTADNLRKLKTMRPQRAHQLKKSVHSTYMFHLAGCKWLLSQFLRVPLFYEPTQAPSSSAERPAWNQLLSQSEEHKKSDEYRKAVEDSQRKGDDHVKLSGRIWWARHDHEKGKNISFRILRENLNWDSLSPSDQEAVQEYVCGRSACRLHRLIAEQEKKRTDRYHLLRMQS